MLIILPTMENRLQALSIDDEQLNLILIEEMAQKLGLEITSFTEPLKALEYLKENPVDLIFTDYMMPAMDGVAFIEEARKVYSDIPIIMITAVNSDNELKLRALKTGATDFLNKPLNLPEFRARVQNLRRLRESQLLYKNWADMLREEVAKATEEISQREYETLIVLGNAAEYKDTETGEHTQRVAHYSRLIAEAVTDDADFHEQIFRASPLHDIGKIGIPDTILLKPAKLSEEEFGIIKTHTNKGYEIISNTQSLYLKRGAEIAISHHEKWNGTGYPYGLKGKDIPLSGRIVAVVDVFDALTSRRPYKEPWSFGDAVELIKKEREQHFAPDAVDAFFSQLTAIKEVFDTNTRHSKASAAPGTSFTS
ncbi:MAG: HD domain-containing phosphohydrolase [Spirochaetaceae bacterium]